VHRLKKLEADALFEQVLSGTSSMDNPFFHLDGAHYMWFHMAPWALDLSFLQPQRSIYSDGVEVQEAYNNHMRSMRRQITAWQGKPTQLITRTILELLGNRKAPAEDHACVQGMLLVSTKAMSERFKSKSIGMTDGEALVPQMLAGPANPSGTYDRNNKLTNIADDRMRVGVDAIILATHKLRGMCGPQIASSKRLMRYGIRQAWRIVIGREVEPPWITYIGFDSVDIVSREKKFKEVGDSFSAILRKAWYPRGTHPMIKRPHWLPSESEAERLEVVLEWWAMHVLAANSSNEADYKINIADATLLEADMVGGSDNVGPSGLCARGTVRPLSTQGGRAGSRGRGRGIKAGKRPKVA